MSDFREITFSPLSPSSEFYEGTSNEKNTDHLKLKLDFKTGESSYWGASFNFINSIVGAGIIGKWKTKLFRDLPQFKTVSS